MGKYLDRFASMIGQTQTEQVMKLLNKKRDVGQIRTVKEFSKKLEDALRELTQNGITPMMQIREAMAGDIIEEQIFNFMLDGIEDDLVTGFKESAQLEFVQNAHDALVRDLFLRKLKEGLEELKTKVAVYKFLNQDASEFDRAQYATFRGSNKHRVSRADSTSSQFVTDPRTHEYIPYEDDAFIDTIGERLILPYSPPEWISVQEVTQVWGAQTSQGTLLVEPLTTPLENMLDGRRGTYWLQSVLTPNRESTVHIKLQLQLTGVHTVTMIDIEPVLDMPVMLTGISFRKSNNEFAPVNISPTVVSGRVRLDIPRVETDILILEFANSNPRKIDFEYNSASSNLFEYIVSDELPSLSALAPLLSERISSSKIRTAIGSTPASGSSFSGYSYTFGIDNIRVGMADYRRIGLYIGKSFEIDDMGVIGVKANEVRPYNENGVLGHTSQTYDTGLDDRWFLGSIEYWVSKEELSSDGTVLRNSMFPVLPIGVKRVYHERLILDEKSSPNYAFYDIGKTLFMADTMTPGSLKVYRNGTLMTTGWTNVTTSEGRTPNSGTAMRTRLQIGSPNSGDIYTVSYDVVTSTLPTVPKKFGEVTSLDGIRVVDIVGDLSARMVDSNMVATEQKVVGATQTRYTLRIILRRNSTDFTVSSSVEEFFFLGGTLNSDKLTGMK